MKLHPLHLAVVLLGILGVWLIYWNITDFMVIGIDTGTWDWSIIQDGWKSITAGIVLLGIFFWKGIRVIC